CEDLLRDNPVSIRRCAAVFASSGGDYPIIDQICKALCEPERLVSPTQFHNSVHNSAAGYWSIATGSRAPSTSISAFDDTFAAGLQRYHQRDRKSTRLNSSHVKISYAVFCLKKKKFVGQILRGYKRQMRLHSKRN